MNFSLTVQYPDWQTVYTIAKGTILQKGRHGLYHDIVKAAGAVNVKFGCYSWGSNSEIFYCGSFAKDYVRGNFKTNLHGRIHNYLQNHKQRTTGRINTNLMVFEKINESLQQNDILLRLFTFRLLEISGKQVDFANFSTDAHLVHAVEELLICNLPQTRPMPME